MSQHDVSSVAHSLLLLLLLSLSSCEVSVGAAVFCVPLEILSVDQGLDALLDNLHETREYRENVKWSRSSEEDWRSTRCVCLHLLVRLM